MLVELIAKNAGAAQTHRPYYPSPSKAGKCIRSLVYHASGVVPDPFPDRTMLVFDDGNLAEEQIKNYLRKTKFEVTELKGPENRISIADIDGVEMTGEPDAILRSPDGKTYLLEIKTSNHFTFERLTDAPLEDHARQANLYMHGLNKKGWNINTAIILYKNKNTANMKEFFVYYNLEKAKEDIEMFRSVAVMTKDGVVPDRPHEITDWQCSYCRWPDHCWDGYKQELEALSSDVALNEELETTARYYNELGGQESDIKKEREELKGLLKAGLRTAKAQSGRVGNYYLKLTYSERKPNAGEKAKDSAKKTTRIERLTVKNLGT